MEALTQPQVFPKGVFLDVLSFCLGVFLSVSMSFCRSFNLVWHACMSVHESPHHAPAPLFKSKEATQTVRFVTDRSSSGTNELRLGKKQDKSEWLLCRKKDALARHLGPLREAHFVSSGSKRELA